MNITITIVFATPGFFVANLSVKPIRYKYELINSAYILETAYALQL